MIGLRRYFDELRKADQAAVAQAKLDVDRRLEAMNELREQIHTERGHFVTTETYDARHEDLSRRINALELWKANVAGRAVVFSLLGALLVATAGALIAHLFG